MSKLGNTVGWPPTSHSFGWCTNALVSSLWCLQHGILRTMQAMLVWRRPESLVVWVGDNPKSENVALKATWEKHWRHDSDSEGFEVQQITWALGPPSFKKQTGKGPCSHLVYDRLIVLRFGFVLEESWIVGLQNGIWFCLAAWYLHVSAVWHLCWSFPKEKIWMKTHGKHRSQARSMHHVFQLWQIQTCWRYKSGHLQCAGQSRFGVSLVVTASCWWRNARVWGEEEKSR